MSNPFLPGTSPAKASKVMTDWMEELLAMKLRAPFAIGLALGSAAALSGLNFDNKDSLTNKAYL